MSQRHVERVIGRLATDESFRLMFLEDPAAALRKLAADGVELNECERRAVLAIDRTTLVGFAEALDPRIQKTDLKRFMP
ncbi:MAG: Os1348 family NHLP clan protein [Candidatus Polarisedimenticolia bacterium]